MSTLYNRAFKVGFASTVVLFGILNFISYRSAKQQHDEILSHISWNVGRGFNWGFPFAWWGYSDWMFEDGFLGLILNFVVIVGCGSIVGVIVRQVVAKKSGTN